MCGVEDGNGDGTVILIVSSASYDVGRSMNPGFAITNDLMTEVVLVRR